MTQYIVDMKLKLKHRISSGQEVSHLMKNPSIIDMNEMERNFPGWFLRRVNGKIESDSDLNERKVFLYNRLCEEISGYWFTETCNVPPLDKIRVINSITAFTPQSESEIKSEFGSEFIEPNGNGNITLYAVSKQLGKLVCNRFVLKQPEMKDIKDFDRITALDQAVVGTTMKYESKRTAEGLCCLFDSLCLEAHGYQTQSDDVLPSEIVKLVPVLHKMNIIRNLFDKAKEELDEFEGN